jgi:hypothetical protein
VLSVLKYWTTKSAGYAVDFSSIDVFSSGRCADQRDPWQNSAKWAPL